MMSNDPIDTHHEPIPSHAHEEHEVGHIVNYPNHPERKASALYNRTHHELCVVQDTPCFRCGFRHSQSTPHRTTETHHMGLEWAFQGATDWDKFVAKMAILAEIFTALSKIDPELAKKDPTSVVDSISNMLVICSVCHRDPVEGIHHTPFPEWILQAFAIDGFQVLEKVVPHAH